MNEQLAAIRARRDAATPGVWSANTVHDTRLGIDVVWVENSMASIAWCGADCRLDVHANATFIAAAPADVDTLLAEVERLTGELATVRAQANVAWQQEHTERVRLEERLKAAEQRAQALQAQLAQTTDERDEEWATRALGL